MRIASWGRLSNETHDVSMPANQAEAREIITRKPGIAFGNGRSYGDEALNPGGALWLTRSLDRFLAFDESTGVLSCEAGVLLRDIQRLFVPRGWMLPVCPGTQLVTVGGAIANDVHGKNHHGFGSFGDHVLGIRLARTTGEILDCSPAQQPDWFAATVGGMGLTGLILQAEIRLRRVQGPWLESETIPYTSLNEYFQLADTPEAGWEYTVSWIDCLSPGGRGLFMRGNHLQQREDDKLAKVSTDSSRPGIPLREPARKRPLAMPFQPPFSLVNRLSLKPFNTLYYAHHSRKSGRNTVHYEPFFYPLDNLLQWNLMYGPKGFYQYQSVVPPTVAREAVQAMLQAIATSGDGSFLAVLKNFGNRQAPGMLSFPQPGVTLALDFPNRGERTHRLFRNLDAIVREAGGRIYAAKDARMPRDLFEQGYPALDKFRKYRDPGIRSAMSRRLMGD
ncbi:MAG: FAD-binding oxidoreductase [Lautropia sp.]|nr:FAD-binding oxidoreductase [Lautropia sp.]